jgi:hypothetical protein
MTEFSPIFNAGLLEADCTPCEDRDLSNVRRHATRPGMALERRKQIISLGAFGMKIFAWLFFRPLESGWRRHLISISIALTAVAVAALYYNMFTQIGSREVVGGHPQTALEQALVFNFCGKYGYLSPNVNGSERFFQRESWPPDQKFSEAIVARYGEISQFCEKDFQRFLNGENSLSLLLSALLLLPPDDSVTTLAVKLVLFECIVLFLALYFLGLFGAGLLPLFFLSMATVKLLSAQPTVISQYPAMSLLLLFSSALLALLWPDINRRKPHVLSLAGVGVGIVLAFVYNWRTSYGLIMAVQVIILLFIAALKYYHQDRILRNFGVISGAVVIGFFVFQAALIWPLQKNIQYTYSHHPIWHPIVLGLGALPNPLAEREGIKWEDSAAWQIAKRIDPSVTYLGPKYDHALRSYYFELWKRYPWEMIGIYSKGIFETGRTIKFPLLGRLAQIVIRNGFVWLSILLSIAIGGYFLLSLNSRLAIFTILLSAALIGVSLEGAVVMPTFTLAYQGSLAAGFEALLAVLIVLAFARANMTAQMQNSSCGGVSSRSQTMAISPRYKMGRKM